MGKQPQGFKFIYYGLTFGVTMAITLYLGYKGGEWLDNYFGTETIFALLGIVLGIVVSFKNLWSTLMNMEQGKSKYKYVDKSKEKNTSKQKYAKKEKEKEINKEINKENNKNVINEKNNNIINENENEKEKQKEEKEKKEK